MRLSGFGSVLPIAMAACLSASAPPTGTPSSPIVVPKISLGQMEIRVLQDGEIALPSALLKDIDPVDSKRMLGGKDAAPTPVKAYLIRTPEHLVLVDTGMGKTPEGGDSGHLTECLKAAGVDPAQVDLVLITHFHFDHIGGLLNADGTRAFPKAILRVSQAENDFWLSEPSKLPDRLKAGLPKLKASLAPYLAAKAYQPFAPEEVLGKGIKALPAYGHTGGHTAYAFSSEGKELWCIGDLIHFGAIQFERPSVGVIFDADGSKAVSARKEFFHRAAQSQAILAGAHLPSLVQIQAKGDGFLATTVPTH